MAINQNMLSADEEQAFSQGLRPAVLVAIIALAVAYLGFFFATPLPATFDPPGSAILHAPQQTQHLAARENGSRAVAFASRHDPRVPVPPPLAVLSSGAENFLFVGRSSDQLIARSSPFVSGRISRANLARAPPSLSA